MTMSLAVPLRAAGALRLIAFAMLMVLALAPPRATAQTVDGSIVVTPGAIVADIIAVPDFEPEKGASLPAGSEVIAETIYRNLEISGLFKRPGNPAHVAEARAQDRQKNAIDFLEWRRLKAEFLVLGQMSVIADQVSAIVRVYDTASGKSIFGNRYRDFAAKDLPTLGRRIADDIVYRLTGSQGIALTQIAYVSVGANAWIKDVWTIWADGGGRRQITNDNSTVAAPCWGMNGTEIYYTSYKDHNPDLCGVRSDGSRNWFVSRQPNLNISPNWSEKNQRIVLTLARDGNSEIYVMDRTGRNLARLTRNVAIDSSPCWSPNGKQIAFTSNRSGSPQIWVMDYDGMGARQITRLAGYDYCDGASWSPKGDKIAFAGRCNGRFDICVVNIDGSGAIRLTDGPGDKEDPSWSPSGTHLAYSSNQSGSKQIWVIRADGTAATQLTTRGTNYSPSWGPFMK